MSCVTYSPGDSSISSRGSASWGCNSSGSRQRAVFFAPGTVTSSHTEPSVSNQMRGFGALIADGNHPRFAGPAFHDVEHQPGSAHLSGGAGQEQLLVISAGEQPAGVGHARIEMQVARLQSSAGIVAGRACVSGERIKTNVRAPANRIPGPVGRPAQP